MLALRENVSSCSTRRSLLIVMEQAGVEESPGTLPAVKVVRHVTPMKSPPAAKTPSVVTDFHDSSKHHIIYTAIAFT